MLEQLPLPIFLHEDLTFANFYPGNNAFLLASLTAIAQGQGERYLYLWGQSGSGRSHLLHACCHRASELGLRASYLPLTQLNKVAPEVLENLESFDLIAIDDINHIAGNAVWQEALFHFYNRSFQTQTRIIIAGSTLPNELGLQLLDLSSRLNNGLALAVQPLTDEEKIAALQLRATNRGFELPIEVAQFLLRHVPRNLANLFAILDKLDHASLAAQKKLTIPFVKKALSL